MNWILFFFRFWFLVHRYILGINCFHCCNWHVYLTFHSFIHFFSCQNFFFQHKNMENSNQSVSHSSDICHAEYFFFWFFFILMSFFVVNVNVLFVCFISVHSIGLLLLFSLMSSEKI